MKFLLKKPKVVAEARGQKFSHLLKVMNVASAEIALVLGIVLAEMP